MEGVRTLTPYPSIKVHSYDLVARALWRINIRHSYIYRRFQPCQSLSNLLLSLVCHLLSDYLQRTRSNPKNQPATFCVEKGAR